MVCVVRQLQSGAQGKIQCCHAALNRSSAGALASATGGPGASGRSGLCCRVPAAKPGASGRSGLCCRVPAAKPGASGRSGLGCRVPAAKPGGWPVPVAKPQRSSKKGRPVTGPALCFAAAFARHPQPERRYLPCTRLRSRAPFAAKTNSATALNFAPAPAPEPSPDNTSVRHTRSSQVCKSRPPRSRSPRAPQS